MPSRSVRGKRPQFYESQAIDEAFAMIMVLAQELVVLRERLDTVERISDEDGLNIRERIESFVLDEAGLAEREAWRQQLLSSLYYLPRQHADEARAGHTLERYKKAVADIEVGAG